MRVILSAGKKVYFTLLAAFAQCAETDCNTLGYDSPTQCDNSIKCPFGEYWACPGKTTEEEPEESEEEKAVLGQCTGYAKNCNIADILYSDGTCSADVVSGKTPIGIVVYIGSDNCGQALALEDLGRLYWSHTSNNIPGLQNYNSAPVNDFDSCGNTKIVIDYSSKQYGNRASDLYPAFWSVYNYAPSTMPETKGKWCLPSGGVLNSIFSNRATINSSLSRIKKTLLGSDIWWSSSAYSSKDAWTVSMSSGNIGALTTYVNNVDVRPVIEF